MVSGTLLVGDGIELAIVGCSQGRLSGFVSNSRGLSVCSATEIIPLDMTVQDCSFEDVQVFRSEIYNMKYYNLSIESS
jgi:hypothetical protein